MKALPQIDQIQAIVTQYALSMGVSLVVAIVFWIAGRWLIGLAVRVVQSALQRQHVDPTVPACDKIVNSTSLAVRPFPSPNG